MVHARVFSKHSTISQDVYIYIYIYISPRPQSLTGPKQMCELKEICSFFFYWPNYCTCTCTKTLTCDRSVLFYMTISIMYNCMYIYSEVIEREGFVNNVNIEAKTMTNSIKFSTGNVSNEFKRRLQELKLSKFPKLWYESSLSPTD